MINFDIISNGFLRALTSFRTLIVRTGNVSLYNPRMRELRFEIGEWWLTKNPQGVVTDAATSETDGKQGQGQES